MRVLTRSEDAGSIPADVNCRSIIGNARKTAEIQVRILMVE